MAELDADTATCLNALHDLCAPGPGADPNAAVSDHIAQGCIGFAMASSICHELAALRGVVGQLVAAYEKANELREEFVSPRRFPPPERAVELLRAAVGAMHASWPEDKDWVTAANQYLAELDAAEQESRP